MKSPPLCAVIDNYLRLSLWRGIKSNISLKKAIELSPPLKPREKKSMKKGNDAAGSRTADR